MKNLFILIAIFSMFGCKSIKKIKDLEKSAQIEESYMMMSASAMEKSLEVEEAKVVEYEEETETIVESSNVIKTESGDVIVVPTVTTTRSRIRYKEDSTFEQASEIKQEQSSESNNKSSSDTSTKLELDKSSEGMNPIEDAVDALFPTWGKIVISILTALAGVGWKIYQNRKDKGSI